MLETWTLVMVVNTITTQLQHITTIYQRYSKMIDMAVVMEANISNIRSPRSWQPALSDKHPMSRCPGTKQIRTKGRLAEKLRMRPQIQWMLFGCANLESYSKNHNIVTYFDIVIHDHCRASPRVGSRQRWDHRIAQTPGGELFLAYTASPTQVSLRSIKHGQIRLVLSF